MNSLLLVTFIRNKIAQGCPLTQALHLFVSNHGGGLEPAFLKVILSLQKKEPLELDPSIPALRRRMWRVLLQGLSGLPIGRRLEALELELKNQVEQDLAFHHARLPIKLSLPLFAFILPSFFCLILSTIMQQLLEVM